MTISIDLRVLAKYFDGTASAEEKAQVLEWIGSDPERRAAVAELNAAWASNARNLEAPYDADAAWSRVASRAGIAHRVSGPQPARRAGRRWQSPTYGAWAAALILAVAIGGWYGFSRLPQLRVTSGQEPQEREYRTARAQRAMVRLSDGTDVTLNAETRLRIPTNFGAHRRDVYLEGEAYFSVAHDTAAPFVVHTAHGIASDIGTKFNVRAYDDDRLKQLQVVVAEGAVAIAPARGRDSLVLRASQAGRVTQEGELFAEQGVDVHARLGWIEGRLEFKNVPLRDVIPVLARWYDADVHIKDSTLADYTITVTLTGEQFADAVEIVARLIGGAVVQRGSEVTFVRKSAQ